MARVNEPRRTQSYIGFYRKRRDRSGETEGAGTAPTCFSGEFDMSVIAAINLIDRLVLLEDGRELAITKFYASPDETPLKVADGVSLTADMEVEGPEDADVFTVQFPGTDAFLVVEIGAISLTDPAKLN